MSRFKKTVAAVAGSVLLGGGLAVATTAPAEAVTWIWICNNPSSDDAILAYRTQSPFTEAWIGIGRCAQFNDTGGYAKVDTDLPGGGNIHKYRRAKNLGPWESWNCNDNPASDPYSGSGTYTEYWTSENYC